jgi:hypothetical protein
MFGATRFIGPDSNARLPAPFDPAVAVAVSDRSALREQEASRSLKQRRLGIE